MSREIVTSERREQEGETGKICVAIEASFDTDQDPSKTAYKSNNQKASDSPIYHYSNKQQAADCSRWSSLDSSNSNDTSSSSSSSFSSSGGSANSSPQSQHNTNEDSTVRYDSGPRNGESKDVEISKGEYPAPTALPNSNSIESTENTVKDRFQRFLEAHTTINSGADEDGWEPVKAVRVVETKNQQIHLQEENQALKSNTISNFVTAKDAVEKSVRLPPNNLVQRPPALFEEQTVKSEAIGKNQREESEAKKPLENHLKPPNLQKMSSSSSTPSTPPPIPTSLPPLSFDEVPLDDSEEIREASEAPKTPNLRPKPPSTSIYSTAVRETASNSTNSSASTAVSTIPRMKNDQKKGLSNDITLQIKSETRKIVARDPHNHDGKQLPYIRRKTVVKSFEEEYYQKRQHENDYAKTINFLHSKEQANSKPGQNEAQEEENQEEEEEEEEEEYSEEYLNAEYEKLQRMFGEWKRKSELNTSNKGGQGKRRNPSLHEIRSFKELQRCIVKQHRKVQRLVNQSSQEQSFDNKDESPPSNPSFTRRTLADSREEPDDSPSATPNLHQPYKKPETDLRSPFIAPEKPPTANNDSFSTDPYSPPITTTHSDPSSKVMDLKSLAPVTPREVNTSIGNSTSSGDMKSKMNKSQEMVIRASKQPNAEMEESNELLKKQSPLMANQQTSAVFSSINRYQSPSTACNYSATMRKLDASLHGHCNPTVEHHSLSTGDSGSIIQPRNQQFSDSQSFPSPIEPSKNDRQTSLISNNSAHQNLLKNLMADTETKSAVNQPSESPMDNISRNLNDFMTPTPYYRRLTEQKPPLSFKFPNSQSVATVVNSSKSGATSIEKEKDSQQSTKDTPQISSNEVVTEEKPLISPENHPVSIMMTSTKIGLKEDQKASSSSSFMSMEKNCSSQSDTLPVITPASSSSPPVPSGLPESFHHSQRNNNLSEMMRQMSAVKLRPVAGNHGSNHPKPVNSRERTGDSRDDLLDSIRRFGGVNGFKKNEN